MYCMTMCNSVLFDYYSVHILYAVRKLGSVNIQYMVLKPYGKNT